MKKLAMAVLILSGLAAKADNLQFNSLLNEGMDSQYQQEHVLKEKRKSASVTAARERRVIPVQLGREY